MTAVRRARQVSGSRAASSQPPSRGPAERLPPRARTLGTGSVGGRRAVFVESPNSDNRGGMFPKEGVRDPAG